MCFSNISVLLTEKYKPKSLTQIIGNDKEIKKIIMWALDWQRGKVEKPLLIYGPTGVGKTSVAYALKHQFDWELLELNASDIRNKINTEKTVGVAAETMSLFGKTRLILIDDVDKMSSTKDRGGTPVISSFLKTSKQPIILTADDLWDKKIASLRSLCGKIQFKKVNNSSIQKYLISIAEKENINISREIIEEIVSINSGDVRASLNDLQARNISVFRDKQINVFDALRIVLKTTNFTEARNVSFTVDLDHEMFKLWIDENIPREYEKAQDIAKAYNNLSRADIFDGRILKRQYWGFLRYSTDLMTAGVALSKKEKYKKFTGYAFPSYIQKMGSSKTKRATNKQISLKLKKYLKGSTRKIEDSFEIIASILKKNMREGIKFYRLDISDAAYILGVSEAQIKKIMKEETQSEDQSIKIKKKQPTKEIVLIEDNTNNQLTQFF